jgi:iron complex transport system substrate-binding protein
VKRGAVAWALALAGALLGAGAWASTAATPLRLRDDLQREVTLPAVPQRIVALGPSLVEGLCALGGCPRLVGVDRFSTYPPEVRQLPQLGGLGEVSLEQIVSLKPDLVLLTPASRLHDRLQQLGIPVLALDAQTLPEVQRLLNHLARVLGAPERAQAQWAQMQADIDTAARSLPPSWRGTRVYFEVDASLYAAGEASFIGALLARLGLVNTVPAALGTFPKLNPEFIIQAQPQLIFTSPREAPQLAARPGWAQLPAVRQGRVCTLSREAADLVVRPGPRLGAAALAIAACLRALPAP